MAGFGWRKLSETHEKTALHGYIALVQSQSTFWRSDTVFDQKQESKKIAVVSICSKN